MRIDGACHCGALSYEADIDPEKVGVCHCTSGAKRAQLRPRVQLWCRSALPWTAELGAIEQIATQPPM